MLTRMGVRYGILLVGCLWGGNQLLAAYRAWKAWHEWATGDPSLADFYRTEFWLDVGTATLVLGVAVFLFWLLRRRDLTSTQFLG
jgi:hypothetical protein